MKGLALFITLMLASLSVASQNAAPDTELYALIFKQDSLLFDAFNRRDAEGVARFFDEDLEFYHDKTGLTGYAQNVEQTRQNFERGNSPTRRLLPGTMEVYPVPGFGAVQYARHEFCHPEGGQMDCGTFQFVHIWKETEQGWKLARVVSFDH